MKKDKPAGIVAIAIYSAFCGVILLGVGALMMLASGVPDLPLWITLSGVVFMGMGVFLLVSMYGLWSIQGWGLKLAKWIYIVSIPLGVISIFPIYPESEMTTANTILQLIGIGLAASIIRYLSKPKVVSLYQAQ